VASTLPPEEGKPHRGAGFALRLVICVSLLGLVFWATDLADVGRTLASANLAILVLTCAIVVIDRGLMAYKWNLLLRSRGVRISHGEAFRLYLSGHVLATVTPGAIGADAYRVTVLAKPGRTAVVISTVLIERVIGLAVLGAVAALTVPFSARYLGPQSGSITWWTIGLAVITVGGLGLSLYPPAVDFFARRVPFVSRSRLYRKLRDFYDVYADYRNRKSLLAAFAILTVVELLLLIVVNFLAARALGIEVSFVYFLSVMPLLHLLVRLPVSFHGIGVQEGLFAYFLAAVGFTAAEGLSVSLVLRGLEILCLILPGAAILWLAPVRYGRAADSSVATAASSGESRDRRSS
jgi:uncharacterized protein (TIRG00374 family)